VPPESFLKWQIRLDNPTFIGWTVVAVYLGAAACCAWAALKSRGDETRPFAPVWWLLAAGLIFLGINKQLNLQTLMIVIGRNVSFAENWYAARRRIQLIFSAIFAALCLGALAWFSWRHRQFFRENQLVLAGVIVLALFVVLRAATINHTDRFLRLNLKAARWAWVLEIGGSGLIGMGGLRARRPSEK
jgi:ABC-type Fe3+-siderophore transport system permease subunit